MAPPFSLAAVLALRRRLEEKEELALAAISRQLREVEATLVRVDQELAQCANARKQEIGTVRDAATQQGMYARHAALGQARLKLREEGARLAELRRGQQQAYLVARSAREMLTELESKHVRTWSKQQSLAEQKRLDDLFASRRRRD